MFRILASAAVALVCCGAVHAVTLTGTTHIDYYPEGNSSLFCCDGVASYQLQFEPGPQVHIDYFSILDHTNSPVWTVTDFSVNLGGLSAGLQIDMADGGRLRLQGFPGFETTINPDMGENVYTDFGYSFIDLPSLGSIATPEPTSFILMAGCFCCAMFARLKGASRFHDAR